MLLSEILILGFYYVNYCFLCILILCVIIFSFFLFGFFMVFLDFFTSKLWFKIRYFYCSNKRNNAIQKQQKIMFKKYALDALSCLYLGLKEYKDDVNVWLEFGTLLGAYRDKQFINYDYDLDFGIDHDSLTEDLIQHLRKYGFIQKSKFTVKSNDINIDNYNAEYTLSFKGKVNVDLFSFKQTKSAVVFFFFDKEEGLSWEETERKYNQHLRAKTKYISPFTLKSCDFLGIDVKIPDNTQQHLSEIYGDNFMTPIKYSYDQRPKNLEVLLDNKTLGKREYF